MIKRQILISISLLFLLVFGFQNCGKNSARTANQEKGTGNEGASFDGTSSGNPTGIEGEVQADPFSGANRVKLCIVEIKMKPIGKGKEVKVSNDLLIEFDSSGESGAIMDLKKGIYKELKIELANKCDNDQSIEIITDTETRSSDEDIELRFDGEFMVDDTQSLNISIQPLIDATVGLSDSQDIADAVESVLGEISSDDSDD